MENSNIKPLEKLDDNNDDVKKYYDKLIEKITLDWQDQKYDAAISRIKEELDQPYVPYEYENVLTDLFYSYQRELKFKEFDDHTKNLSPEEMLLKIYQNKVFNTFLFEFFMSQYGAELKPSYLAAFQIWLESENIENADKFLILDLLAENNVSHQFVFYNKNVDDDIVLDPMTYRELEVLKPYDEAMEIVNEQTFKDPVVQNFSIDLLNATAYYYFPSFLFSSPEGLAYSILSTVNRSFNMIETDLSQLDEDEKLVNKVLETFNDEEVADWMK